MFHEFKADFNQITDPAKNEIFKKERNLEEIYVFSKEVANYLKSEKIPNLALIDRKARNFYIGIKEYWKLNFPDLKEPNYYFLNPSGFQYQEDEAVIEEFAQVYKDLNTAKDQPLLIFDACIHTGASLLPIKEFFNKNGFLDVRFAAIKSRYQEPGAAVTPDLLVGEEILDKGPSRGCSPFGEGTLVEKSTSHIYSEIATDKKKREEAIQSRKEIIEAIRKYNTKE